MEESTRAVDRALGLLSAAVETPSTLTELARGAELAPSTASRLLGALQRHGHYRSDGVRCTASPTWRTLLYSASSADTIGPLLAVPSSVSTVAV